MEASDRLETGLFFPRLHRPRIEASNITIGDNMSNLFTPIVPQNVATTEEKPVIQSSSSERYTRQELREFARESLEEHEQRGRHCYPSGGIIYAQ